jgi:Uma2 family endonuclease
MTTTADRLITAEEFARLPETEDGSKQELVRGRIETISPPPRFDHGLIQGQICFVLRLFLATHPIGRVTTESGVVVGDDPDTVRGPDVAFWSFQRLPADVVVETYPAVAADLCVEILSPGEQYGRLQRKIGDYLACGVRLVWVVDPESRTVTVYRPDAPLTVLQDNDDITGGDVLPGFTRRVAELFA